MPNLDETIESLKEAVRFSPDNLPLRMILADNLTASGRFEEAAAELTVALARAPQDKKIAVSLAQAFFQAGKHSQAQVIVEDLLKHDECPARAFVLNARLLLNEGKVAHAQENYQKAVSKDISMKDGSLEERLGLIGLKGTQASAPAPNSMPSSMPSSIQNQVPPSAPRLGQTEGGDLSDFDEDIDTSIAETSDIKFEDVGGMDAVKEQIKMKILYPLQHPETFKAYGKKVGGGILLYGPPGCGKTYLARATAGEISAKFVSIGLHQVLDMWIGASEKNLHEVFQVARMQKPCVLFFDEVDALAASRTDMKHTAHRHAINQFLNELDGVNTSNEGILILAATNAPWHLDPAFRRPGRFDRIIFVPPPDAGARASILRIILKGKPQDNLDFDFLAKKTDKFSGADLAALVEDCIEKKIEEAMSKGGEPKPITTRDLEKSIKAIKPSTAEWFSSARNYALYSNESGLYDDIAKYLKL